MEGKGERERDKEEGIRKGEKAILLQNLRKA